MTARTDRPLRRLYIRTALPALMLVFAALLQTRCTPPCIGETCDGDAADPGELPPLRSDGGVGSPDAGAASARDAGIAPSTDGGRADAGAPPIDAGLPSINPQIDAGPTGLDGFIARPLTSGVPDVAALQPLPGGGQGGPVLTSNNPELLTGPGLLYGNARPLLTRGGEAYPLEGDFGVYLHHLVDTSDGRPLWISLIVSNPNAEAVTLTVRGSGYSQDETGGLGLGISPDYRVSSDWILDEPNTVHEDVSIPSARPFLVWQRQAGDYREVDGRFAFQTSAPVYVYVVATETPDLNEAVRRSSGPERNDAPGDYRISGDPPPPFGREAGIYAHDTWRGDIDVALPPGPGHIAWMVNTATGQPFSQVQAFPALTHLEGSAREAVGMYGNVYDLLVQVRHDNTDNTPRQVRLWFSSLATAQISRYWDGVALVDGEPIVVRHTPESPATALADFTLQPGGSRILRVRAMVPGLTSIPQAVAVESR